MPKIGYRFRHFRFFHRWLICFGIAFSFIFAVLPFNNVDPVSMKGVSLSEHLIEIRFKQRLDTLRRFCVNKPRHQSLYSEDNPYNYIELYDYYEANVFVCSPPKAASTTLDFLIIDKFIKPICKNSNYSMGSWDTRNRHRIHGNTTFESINKMRRKKVLITRDPLARLVSFWYDKLSGLMKPNKIQVSTFFIAFGFIHYVYQENWGPLIVEAVRQPGEVTFSKEYGRYLSRFIPSYKENSLAPTLAEFFRFVAYKRGNIADCGKLGVSDCGAQFNHW